jgi:alkaline phosphatase
MRAARRAADQDRRLLGIFGAQGGHLPFQTANGDFDPTLDMKGTEQYTLADRTENPTLAEMTKAALLVLERSIEGFWLMVEVGDVDWANHANNIDSSIGAVLSGEQAFDVVMNWVDKNDAWSYTAVIVTADHGHFLVIDDASGLIEAGRAARRQ